MIVTLDVFSGRPNPSWTLSDRDQRELISRVAGKAVSAVHESQAHLGFRGYIVSAASDDDETATAAGLPDMFRIDTTSLGGIVPGLEQLMQPLSAEEVRPNARASADIAAVRTGYMTITLLVFGECCFVPHGPRSDR